LFFEDAIDRSKGLIVKYTPSGLSLYHLLYLAFSILGIPLYGYTYCFHLLHFATTNEILNRVFLAISSAQQQLGWVAFLLVIIMYNYTLLSFAYLRFAFSQENGESSR
jgi:hypothetical protein